MHANVNIPHFSIPFKFVNHGVGYPTALIVEQDSEKEIMDCVETVLRYEVGRRPEKPEFGIPDFLFKEPSDITKEELEDIIGEWEPRVTTDVTIGIDKLDPLITRILVERRRGGSE